jgi:Tol biopolymer transport system component
VITNRRLAPLFLTTLLCLALLAGCSGETLEQEAAPAEDPAATEETSPAVARDPDPREKRLRNLRQITFGGENAEAYWSPDGTRLIFQSTRPPFDCDQIFTMRADGSEVRTVSTGKGRTTCAFFLPGDRLLYSSTHLGGEECPPTPDFSRGYVWPLYESFDIFTARTDGSDLVRLTDVPGYDAEATVSPDGQKIVFTSDRSGDLEIYSMNLDGSGLRKLTEEPGYDGGPFYSADGTKIVYRAYHPESRKELNEYRKLLKEGLIRPSALEVYVMNANGSGKRQVTDLGGANFAPFFHPDGERIIFSSNHEDPSSREFELYIVNVDGTGLERVTYSEDFDGFPMFSPDGTKLVFASNRFNGGTSETNVFVADWVEDPQP